MRILLEDDKKISFLKEEARTNESFSFNYTDIMGKYF